MAKRRPAHAKRQPLGLALKHLAPHLAGRVGAPIAAAMRSGGRGLISLALGGLMLIAIGLLLMSFVGQVIQSARLEENRASLEAEVADLRAANTNLEAAVAYAESDVNVERIAREQLGYAREGDTVLLPQLALPTPAPADAGAAAPAPTPAAPAIPNAQRWWQALFP